ncbi:MAG: hypothetical protein U0531_13970 [Dehalococcoidia bacterium]
MVGDPADEATRALAREAFRRYLPNRVVAGRPPADERIAACHR